MYELVSMSPVISYNKSISGTTDKQFPVGYHGPERNGITETRGKWDSENGWIY